MEHTTYYIMHYEKIEIKQYVIFSEVIIFTPFKTDPSPKTAHYKWFLSKTYYY